MRGGMEGGGKMDGSEKHEGRKSGGRSRGGKFNWEQSRVKRGSQTVVEARGKRNRKTTKKGSKEKTGDRETEQQQKKGEL